jgi:hypothetical protein
MRLANLLGALLGALLAYSLVVSLVLTWSPPWLFYLGSSWWLCYLTPWCSLFFRNHKQNTSQKHKQASQAEILLVASKLAINALQFLYIVQSQ